MTETPVMDQPTHREPLSVPVHSNSEWGVIAVMLVLSAVPGLAVWHFSWPLDSELL